MQRTYDRYQYAQPDPFGTDQDTVRNMMAKGEIAMIAGGAWELGDTGKKNPDIELSFFALPRSNNPEDTILTIQGQGGYMVSETSPNKDLAIELMEVMFSEEMMLFYQNETGAISTFKNLTSEGANPAFEYANKMMSEGKAFSNSNQMTVMPSAFGDFQANQMSELLMGNVDVPTLAANYDAELTRLLEKE